MNGAIYYATRYGSTADYARWIAEATGLRAFDIHGKCPPVADFDFVVLGSPIIYYKPLFLNWLRRHLGDLIDKPVVLFTVSGAPPGKKVDGWLANSLPKPFAARADIFTLQGRLDLRQLKGFDRIMLIIGGLFNRDRNAAKDEMQGFDYMDKASIQPVVERIRELAAK